MSNPLQQSSGLLGDDSSASLQAGNRPGSSLSVNYLPAKFSSTLLDPGPRRRKPKGLDAVPEPRGGGVEAFRAGESRMPATNDEDYDGVTLNRGWFKKGRKGISSPRRLRWTKFKWILFFANTVV